MHIMEGFLPVKHAIGWGVASAPFVAFGIFAIKRRIAANPEQLAQYRAGKDKLFGFFVGQVMKLSKGKANPQQVNELLMEKLKG